MKAQIEKSILDILRYDSCDFLQKQLKILRIAHIIFFSVQLFFADNNREG
jgi:hypothetical protein